MSREPEKDELTAQVRAAMRSFAEARETDRAEAGLTNLSFQGAAQPNRNVWIDTDLGGKLTVDLEDFAVAGEWDNAVARLAADDDRALVAVARAWLSGADAEGAIAAGEGRVRRR